MTKPNRVKVKDLKAWLNTQPDDWFVFTSEDGVMVHSGRDDADHLPVNNEPIDDNDTD